MERVAIVGVGLIGGSLGMAWRRARSVARVTGIDPSEAALERARELEAIDDGTTDLAAGLSEATVVVLASPPGAMERLAPALARAVAPGTVVTDVGSTKQRVVALMEAALPSGTPFVGGHPMAGSDRSGVEAADPFLFQNAVYVLTPTPATDPEALARVRRLVELTGALPLEMDPGQHDLVVAAISHLPLVVAVALIHAVLDLEPEHPEVLRLAAGGFRDTTRVASSPASLWQDILASNAGPVRAVLRKFRTHLERLDRALELRDAGALARALERAGQGRARIPTVSKGLLPASFDAVVVAEDRPGEIGRLATALGAAGVNIRDLEILRVREGEGGTVRLAFASREAQARALAVLREAGFKAHRRD